MFVRYTYPKILYCTMYLHQPFCIKRWLRVNSSINSRFCFFVMHEGVRRWWNNTQGTKHVDDYTRIQYFLPLIGELFSFIFRLYEFSCHFSNDDDNDDADDDERERWSERFFFGKKKKKVKLAFGKEFTSVCINNGFTLLYGFGTFGFAVHTH